LKEIFNIDELESRKDVLGNSSSKKKPIETKPVSSIRFVHISPNIYR